MADTGLLMERLRRFPGFDPRGKSGKRETRSWIAKGYKFNANQDNGCCPRQNSPARRESLGRFRPSNVSKRKKSCQGEHCTRIVRRNQCALKKA